ncbi:hypothetical protein BC835DRAFT_1366041 [Cytidiella melzeri]|nr:hypothetical protein BC835DRAFT_1366041 [Cytidiella melzeri]
MEEPQSSQILSSQAAVRKTPPSTATSGPIPMSFPAILSVPVLGKQLSQSLCESSIAELPTARQKRSNRRDEKEGKRWIRRKDNARFVDNPHVVPASKRDFAIPIPSARPTFPQPLPKYLSRNIPIPPTVPTMREPVSASAGRFSLGMKGMRKQLRKSGPRAELLVHEVESEIMDWLANTIWLNPDGTITSDEEAIPIGTSHSITQVSRTPMQLVWAISDDGFARYVVHCCARYHNIVSFSKDVSGRRLTHILRPNITRPAFEAPQGLNTPPVTDLESSTFDTESDFTISDRDSLLSDAEIDSDVELGPGMPPPRSFPLADIPESSPGSPALRGSDPLPALGDSWSVVKEGDADADVEHDLAQSVASLDLEDDTTPRAARQQRQGPLRSHLWERQRRAASSPSRSPARKGRIPPRPRQLVVQKLKPNSKDAGPRLFYEYLFA